MSVLTDENTALYLTCRGQEATGQGRLCCNSLRMRCFFEPPSQKSGVLTDRFASIAALGSRQFRQALATGPGRSCCLQSLGFARLREACALFRFEPPSQESER